MRWATLVYFVVLLLVEGAVTENGTREVCMGGNVSIPFNASGIVGFEIHHLNGSTTRVAQYCDHNENCSTNIKAGFSIEFNNGSRHLIVHNVTSNSTYIVKYIGQPLIDYWNIIVKDAPMDDHVNPPFSIIGLIIGFIIGLIIGVIIGLIFCLIIGLIICLCKKKRKEEKKSNSKKARNVEQDVENGSPDSKESFPLKDINENKLDSEKLSKTVDETPLMKDKCLEGNEG